jgi:hypothetical protein
MHRISAGHRLASDPYNSHPSGVSTSAAQTHYSIGKSYYFAGTQTQPFYISDNAAFAVYPITVEAWLYSTATSDFIIELQNPTTGQYTCLGNNFIYQQAQSGGTSANSSATAWTSNAWHHVAFTMWNSLSLTTSADRITWWVDGIFVSTFTIAGVSPNYSATGETRLLLGLYQYSLTGGNSPFTGYISEIRVSNNARYGTSGATFTPPAAAMTGDANTILLDRAPNR